MSTISSLFITTETIVTEIPKPEPLLPADGPGMGGMGY